MARPALRLAALVVVAVLVVWGACTIRLPSGRGLEKRPVVAVGSASHSPSHARTGSGAGPVFTPCGRQPADGSRTNLRPSLLTAADRALAGPRAKDIPEGTLVVEAATELDVRDGFLGAGSGYAAAVGQPDGVAKVADATVGVAPVSVAVLDSPNGGRLVAFVEIRLDATPPVAWAAEPRLGIGTDGGDGGFVALGPSPTPEEGDANGTAVDDYLAAAFAGAPDHRTWNHCLVRSTGGHVDGVLFTTGFGDGGYPTYLGKDATGKVVSVVSFGAVLPWNLSGLPGTPPPADEVGP